MRNWLNTKPKVIMKEAILVKEALKIISGER